MKRQKPMNRNPAKQSGSSDRPPGALDRDIQAKIGDQLRAMHDDIVNQGVPDRFADLLARLDKPDTSEGE
jgi:Anti-sigma factor NepR